ncbi:dicarboxylate/amino acid:cation symporter [Campylobacter ureolyticus]|uniref:Sodium:dicarboxylate symporter, SDF family n=1 Tax=Campylobacter ureolyticus TaxID=827 RepID=A0AAE7EAN1_9BACT|nr:dicarboxylate/amino acid:cation symporter [Campylobacter ureolyticus]MCR8685149.1 dicarboxylate/amino acid:cation symporter [Campylobacter ureolyticus]QKF84665.1 sodium:dicarboxylate symporter, SDF family [Campylobacter ureolyticus]QQY35168.1 dicarboxylate/amino acid:cation symporter [Campylobacter ureolyticus]SUX21716.1 proton/sodium-glutamate symport protein (glutamate-aspartate carrierprotein) [Campylobacter ureolyticus]
MKKVFGWYFKANLAYRILGALVIGSIIGMIVPKGVILFGNTTLLSVIAPFGDLFIRLLKMIIVPIIVASLIMGTSSIEPSKLGRVGGKAVFFYFATTLFAIVIGLACAFVFRPGSGLDLSDASVAVSKTANAPSISEIFLSIVPTNPISSMANTDVLAIICFCIFFGVGLAFCKESNDERIKNSANTVFNFFDGISEIMFKMVRWIMEYAPIGVFALMFAVFNKSGAGAFSSLANVTIALYVGLALQVILVYCGICLIMKLNPVDFIKKVKDPMLTAFVTRSSNATLPISMDTAEHKMGVPKGVYSFVLPVGATVNMNGTTVYLGVCSLFIANACGIDLTMGHYITIVITSILAAIGTAGIPGAGAIMLLLILESIGLKVEGNVAIAYGMILGIDAILDMGRTSMNVVGDVVASIWVAKTEGELDESKWEHI